MEEPPCVEGECCSRHGTKLGGVHVVVHLYIHVGYCTDGSAIVDRAVAGLFATRFCVNCFD